MSITEFLEARISEDEREALDAPKMRDIYNAHLAAYTPRLRARVLAECASKRAIMKEHELDLHSSAPYCDGCAEWWASELGEGPPPVKYPCPTIRAIAAVYADHPDYLDDWTR